MIDLSTKGNYDIVLVVIEGSYLSEETMNKNKVQSKHANTTTESTQVIKQIMSEDNVNITKVFSHDGRELNALTSVLEFMYENAPQFTHNENGFNSLMDFGLASEGKTKRFYNVAFGKYSTLKKNATLGFRSLTSVDRNQKPKTKQLVEMDRNINKFNNEKSIINFVAYLHIWVVSVVGISMDEIGVDSVGRFNKKAKGYFADFGIEFNEKQDSVLGYMPNVLSDEFEAPKHLAKFYNSVAKTQGAKLEDLATEFAKSEEVKAFKTKKKGGNKNTPQNQIMIADDLTSEGNYFYFNSKDATKLIGDGYLRNIGDAIVVPNAIQKLLNLSDIKTETKGNPLGSIKVVNQDITKLKN